MRIGMILDTPFPPDARVENEAKTLLEAGHEVHLFHIDYRIGRAERFWPAGERNGTGHSGGKQIKAELGPDRVEQHRHGSGQSHSGRHEEARSGDSSGADRESGSRSGTIHGSPRDSGIERNETFIRKRHEGIELYGYRGGTLLYKLSALAYTVPFYRWMTTSVIREFIRQARPDILHIHDMVIAEAAFRANRAFMLPVLLDLHENRPEIMKEYKHVNSIPGRWLIDPERWKRKQQQLMEMAGHVVLVSDEARRRAEEVDGISMEKTTALPNVVRLEDVERWPARGKSEDIGRRRKAGAAEPPGESADDGDDTINGDEPEAENKWIEGPKLKSATAAELTEGKFTMLYIGDTSLRRGTMTAVQAAERLRRKIDGLQLLFVGQSSQDDHLYSYVRNHNLGEVVRFEGWQHPDRLPAYLKASELGLSPLLRNPHHDTTFANKLFLYMAAGLPVVASDCPAQAGVVRKEQCGLVFRAGDPEALAEVVLELYNDRETRERMGRRGAEAVEERWNWERTGRKLLDAYKKVYPAGRSS